MKSVVLNEVILNKKTGSELWLNTEVAIWFFNGEPTRMARKGELENLLMLAKAKGFYERKNLQYLRGHEIRVTDKEIIAARKAMWPIATKFSNYRQHDFMWEYSHIEGVVIGHDENGYPLVEGKKHTESYEKLGFYSSKENAKADGYENTMGGLWYKEKIEQFKGVVS